jgi:hypothetical protein
MAANLFPVDAVSGAPSYTGRAARQTLGGLWTKATSRLLGARSGLHPATIGATIVTATSTTWTVLPHTGVLDLEANAIAGPYDYSFDANQTGAVTAADVSNPRVDSLFIQVSDPAEGDGTSTPGVAVVYLAGIAGAAGGARGAAGGPPNFPNTRCMELAQITVPKSGGGSPSVLMVAPYTVATGGILPVAGVSAYPASPYLGQYIDATLGLMRWNGTIWFPVGNPPLFVGSQATPQSLTAGVWTAVALDTNNIDTANGHSTTVNNTRYTAQVAGWYDVKGGVGLAAGVGYLRIDKNGAILSPPAETGQSSGLFMQVAAVVQCAVGDYIELFCYAASSSTTLGGGATVSARWVHS